MEEKVGADEVIADWIAIRIPTKVHERTQQGIPRIHQEGIPQQKRLTTGGQSQMYFLLKTYNLLIYTQIPRPMKRTTNSRRWLNCRPSI